MTTATTLNPFRAPTSPEASSLECTHVACDSCDTVEPWPAGAPLSGWSCEFCGDEQTPVPEHHSSTPLGYRDDKACHWPGYELSGERIPDVWVYKAKAPAA